MARNKWTPVVGAALILLFTGCEGSDSPDPESPSVGTRVSPLAELHTISAAGDPLADVQGAVRVLAELQYTQSRLIAYSNGESCGILVLADNDSKGKRIHLVSKWPAEGDGSNVYPAGPYNSASGAGDAGTWASMLCSKNAMVIEYAPGEEGGPKQSRGQIAVTSVPNDRATSRIVIGDSGARRQIEGKAKRPGAPTP
ncbi:hypothetical protein [Streptomyces virginiae]|uniref:Lipoprotein n=1 Tax=Streptomyces virginiae TaxID=1961 RepID=A0ABZ1T8Z2_STRVG|nr:hypothetical protein [Streptomyces virginiae]WTB21829.1 hypothetical protein OG253_10170 [Streptomyces virginiae]